MGTIRYRAEIARDILKQCMKMNRKYIDNEFPHEIQSIELFENYFENVIWLRPH